MEDSHHYEMRAKALTAGLSGFVGTLGAYVASQTHDPLTAITSAVLIYATAESANSLAGKKPLILKAASGIKKGFNKIRYRV